MGANPKYLQIEEYIKEQIDNGTLSINDQIETEESLCNRFGFSRMTVNKAITHLADSGYIKRIPGKGSFVSTPHVRKQSGSSSSFSEDMKKIGLKAGSKLISYKIIKGSDNPRIKSILNLNDDDLIHYFIRLRTGNDTPIAVSYTYISAKVLPAIDVSCLSNSFYAYLDSLKIKRKQLYSELSAVLPSNNEKKWLHINEGALLKSAHTTYTEFNDSTIPFEYIETNYNGDMYSYILSGTDITLQHNK